MEKKKFWNVRLYKNISGTITFNGEEVRSVDLFVGAELSRLHEHIQRYDCYEWERGSSPELLKKEFDRYLWSLVNLDLLDLELLWYLKKMPITLSVRRRILRVLAEMYDRENELVNIETIFLEKPFHSSLVIDEKKCVK